MNEDLIKEQLRITNSIYYALLLWQVVFFVIAYILISSDEFSAYKELDEIFQIIVPIFGFAIMAASRFLYIKNIAGVDTNSETSEKLIKYKTFKIIQWAMVEGAATFAVIALMLTGNNLYTVVFVFLIGYFIVIKPSKENFRSDMKLISSDSD